MWNKITLEKDLRYSLGIGDLLMWVSNSDKEWKVSYNRVNEPTPEFSPLNVSMDAAEKDWITIVADKNRSLNIVPSLPDRPVVIKPLNEFKILPKSNTQLFIPIPVWLQLYAGTEKKERLIMELPSEELSSTWVGEADNGILAYSLKNKLHSQLDKNKLAFHEVLCPVKVSNESGIILDFNRFVLNVDQLSIYTENNKLFTNEVHVKFKGESVLSDVHFATQSPSFIEGAKKISEPRDGSKKNALKRSFYFFKSLTQY